LAFGRERRLRQSRRAAETAHLGTNYVARALH
jgi:hypothetical protein